MSPLNIQNHIKFQTKILKKDEIYKINWIEIITVISGEVGDRIKWKLEDFQSSIFYAWEIKAINDTLITIVSIDNKDIALNKVDVDKIFWDFCRTNWKQLRELYDVEWFEKVDLYRSDKIEYEYDSSKYKFNFRFCWAMTNCRLHNIHNFVEVHTCIVWDWFMQKFDWNDEEKLLETVWLMPWNTHRQFNIIWEFEENWSPKYPFHRWLGWNTGNIWLAIEKY